MDITPNEATWHNKIGQHFGTIEYPINMRGAKSDLEKGPLERFKQTRLLAVH